MTATVTDLAAERSRRRPSQLAEPLATIHAARELVVDGADDRADRPQPCKRCAVRTGRSTWHRSGVCDSCRLAGAGMTVIELDR